MEPRALSVLPVGASSPCSMSGPWGARLAPAGLLHPVAESSKQEGFQVVVVLLDQADCLHCTQMVKRARKGQRRILPFQGLRWLCESLGGQPCVCTCAQDSCGGGWRHRRPSPAGLKHRWGLYFPALRRPQGHLVSIFMLGGSPKAEGRTTYLLSVLHTCEMLLCAVGFGAGRSLEGVRG